MMVNGRQSALLLVHARPHMHCSTLSSPAPPLRWAGPARQQLKGSPSRSACRLHLSPGRVHVGGTGQCTQHVSAHNTSGYVGQRLACAECRLQGAFRGHSAGKQPLPMLRPHWPMNSSTIYGRPSAPLGPSHPRRAPPCHAPRHAMPRHATRPPDPQQPAPHCSARDL